MTLIALLVNAGGIFLFLTAKVSGTFATFRVTFGDVSKLGRHFQMEIHFSLIKRRLLVLKQSGFYELSKIRAVLFVPELLFRNRRPVPE